MKKPASIATLPPSVRVGAHKLKFIVSTPEKHPETAGCNGLCDFDNGRIYLDKTHLETASLDHILNTVMHEVTHAVNHVFGVEDGAQEEHFCKQHTNGILGVYLDNPKYFSWIAETLEAISVSHQRDE